MMSESSMITRLADGQHEIWAHWMRYLFKCGTKNEDGSVTIPADKVERWERQMVTNYHDLSHQEQRSDVSQAHKVMALIRDEIDKLLAQAAG